MLHKWFDNGIQLICGLYEIRQTTKLKSLSNIQYIAYDEA